MAEDSRAQVERKASRLGNVSAFAVARFPKLPTRLRDRYPELKDWETEVERWVEQLNATMRQHLSATNTQ